MAETMTPDQSVALIKANLFEILNPEIIDDVVLKQKRSLRVYWGTAPTGRPHCGYFVPMIKIAELLHAGCHVQILLADLHAYLDNMKSTLELVKFRAKYYEWMIKSTLKGIGVDISQLHFVLGSTFQQTGDYFLDTLKLCGPTTISNAQRAGAEVVKQTDNPCLGGLIYPMMQALDEEYLKVDAQFGGVDQRKIFTCALENLPRIGYKVRAHLMNPMVPSLGEGEKMSASDPNSKIDLLDGPSVVEKKLKKAVCVPKKVEGNGVLAFVENVVFRAQGLKAGKGTPYKFVVEVKGGESLEYTDATKLKEDYGNDVLTPQLLKPALIREINNLLAPIQAEFAQSKEWQEVEKTAYPPPEPEQKKVKQKKDKGDPAKREAAKLARQAQLAAKEGAEGATEGVAKIEVKN